jgi:hypothetical protein
MNYLLRYNSRHSLYFPGDGKLPQLNPLMSSSHSKSGKRTKSFSEPLWMFRLRQRVFCFSGWHRCGSRGENLAMFRYGNDGGKELPDTWDRGPDDNRTCSYCGSIHPDDLMKICRKTLVDERYGIEGTTKSYKVYVRQPGVRNASEGAIKFYMHHAPANPTKADRELFDSARKVTHERFVARWAPQQAAKAS